MKLLRVKILGENFRSLTANVDYVFNDTVYENKLSTKVFAGLNGSGKSNFLELLAEIFYYIERSQLKNTERTHFEDINTGFEIKYILPKTKKDFYLVEFDKNANDILNLDKNFDNDVYVKITKNLVGVLELSFSLHIEKNFSVVRNNYSHFLPTRIIAYTSGQNELLSNPFVRLRYHYFTRMVNSETTFCNKRLYFLDQESNYSIFIANMLLGREVPLPYIKKIFSIVDLHSFRITINYDHSSKEAQKLLAQKLPLIEPLKACATSWIDHKESKCLILDFVIDDDNIAIQEAFKFYYDKSAFQLFQTFYELQSLNVLIEKTQTRKFVESASKDLNISDELSKPDPSDLVFRIERIKIKKKSKDDQKIEIIDYKSLSDGEHQLNEVIGSVMMMEEEGSLFLMDEPDTHFNPKWRAKMVTMLNKVSGNEYDEKGNPENIRKHEIIMTTHSPFIISDNYKEDVYKFIRNEGKLNFEKLVYETYGASISFILETIFNRDVTISDYSNTELNDLKESIKNLDDVKRVKKELLSFGESIEKFDAYSYLMAKEKELKSGQNAN
ncbi:restriction system-associated AAA family ATPase [Flavobacterium oreochromis]|uniref:Restriction system-associated AAA family ATPase n=1 Tax=Flavobacterium oreochromis TaxID=2906078 RepID=A0ABW8PAM3_9FLAO